MNNLIKQILLGSKLGDGSFRSNHVFTKGSKHKEWIDFTMGCLKDYISPNSYYFVPKNGYSQTPYHKMTTLVHNNITLISKLSLKETLEQLDEVGLATWVYDDGSFHKHNHFYNINTHSFTYQEHIQYIIPALFKFGIKAEVLREEKKDGRVFYYTYVSKRTGAEIINKILKKYPIDCFKYKTLDSNINDSITVKFVRTTNINSGKTIVHDNLKLACKYLHTYPAKLRYCINSNLLLSDNKVEYYYYDYCSTTMAKASTLK